MKCNLFSYRYGLEIVQHENFRYAWNEISAIITQSPLFIYPNKSSKNARLDVVQQLMNAYFDRVFTIEKNWSHHPLATEIPESKLRADYLKKFDGRRADSLSIQTEVQFGNMSRWYSDIFKFQAAYSAKKIQLGLSVIPMAALARRIDSNVVNFERATRELPSAELSVTLPIILVGLEPDQDTQVIDLSQSRFTSVKELTGKGKYVNQRRVVHAFISGTPIEEVGPDSNPGPELAPPVEEEETE